MSNQNEDNLIIFVAILCIALIPVYKLSRFIGADFDITLKAILITIAGLGTAIAFSWYLMREHAKSIITFMITLLWYNWWTVLDNAAYNRLNPLTNESFWWNSGLFKITILLLFLLLSIYLFFREKNKWRY